MNKVLTMKRILFREMIDSKYKNISGENDTSNRHTGRNGGLNLYIKNIGVKYLLFIISKVGVYSLLHIVQ